MQVKREVIRSRPVVAAVVMTAFMLAGCGSETSIFTNSASSAGGAATTGTSSGAGGWQQLGGHAGHLWAVDVASPGDDWVADLAIAPNNTVHVAGASSKAAQIGGEELSNDGGTDIFAAALAADGTLLWANNYGGSGHDAAVAIDLQPSGEMGIVGHFDDTISISGDFETIGGSDIVVAVLDQSGEALHSLAFGSTKDDTGRGILFAPGGEILVGGQFMADMEVLSVAVPASAGGSDLFVASFNAELTDLNWLVSLPATGGAQLNGMARLPGGGFCLVGTFTGSLSAPGMTVTSVGASDGFVATFGAGGQLQWLKRFGGAGHDEANSIVTDESGAIFVGATFEQTADFGSQTLTSNGQSDAVFLGFAADGSVWRAVAFGGAAAERAGGLIAGRGSNCPFMALHFNETLEVGGTFYQSRGLGDVLIVSIDEYDQADWLHHDGGVGNDIASAIAYNTSGHVVVGGWVDDASVDYGVAAVGGKGGLDGVVTVIKPE